jgi:hypothetical protein
MAYGKKGGDHCKSDSDQKPVRMPTKPLNPVTTQSKIRTGNVSGPKNS